MSITEFNTLGSQSLLFLRTRHTLKRNGTDVSIWKGDAGSIDSTISSAGTAPVFQGNPLPVNTGPAFNLASGDRGLITTADPGTSYTAWCAMKVSGTHTDYREIFSGGANQWNLYLNTGTSNVFFWNGTTDFDLSQTLTAGTIYRFIVVRANGSTTIFINNADVSGALTSGNQPTNISIACANNDDSAGYFACINGTFYCWGLMSIAVDVTQRGTLDTLIQEEVNTGFKNISPMFGTDC